MKKSILFFASFISILFFTFNYFIVELTLKKKNNENYRSISSHFLSFPKDFKWCVATAAHQIEGNNDQNDWWQWEQIPGKIKNGDKSGLATDHWNRVEEDLNLMKDLGINQYRMSIEWSRIEPEEGKFNQEAMSHYNQEINELLSNKITPMITLHHFTTPNWLSKKGGLRNKDFPQYFLKYVTFVNENLKDKVQYWITFNEPMVMILGGYVNGVFPPGEKDWSKTIIPIQNILKAHAMAYKEIHKNSKDSIVGMAHHLRIFHPYHSINPIEWYLANKLDLAFNWTIPNALKDGEININVPTIINFKTTLKELKNTQDFFGINYYSRDLIQFTPTESQKIKIQINKEGTKSDLNWEIYPTGLLTLLETIDKNFKNMPIYITENGIADSKDKLRSKFIFDHLYNTYTAIKNGIKIKGYCHWTLMDNFEWAEGFTPRFGLFEMNYKTMERIPRKSTKIYKDIILQNGINIFSE